MATISNPRVGVSPYQVKVPAEPTVLATTVNGGPATVSTASSVTVNGQEALNSLITSSRSGVFAGANVTIKLEEQLFNTTNQVTSTTNLASGNIGAIQFSNGANGFNSDDYFTYTNSNVITPGIRTDGYFYSNGSPFISGGNAAIGNFVFTGDVMSISDDANASLTIQGNSLGNNLNQIIINPTSVDLYAFNTNPYSYAELYLDNGNTEAPIAQIIVDGNSTPQQTWTFDAAGNLTFPTGMHIDNEGPNTRISQNEGALKITAGNTATFTAGYVEIEGNLVAGNVALLSANSNAYPGSLIIKTGDQAATTYVWDFDPTGVLQVPSNATAAGPGTIASANGYPALLAYGSGGGFDIHGGPELDWMNADDPANNFSNSSVLRNTAFLNALGFYIGMNENSVVGNTVARWLFTPDGNLNLPQGGNITEGAIPAYTSLTGNTIVLTPAGGTSADQQLVIYPTATPGADANHLHLTSGNLYNTELFLGDDFLYVKLANTGNIVVNSNDLVGNAAQWTFAADGMTSFPVMDSVKTLWGAVDEDFYIKTTRTDPGNDADIELHAADDLRLFAEGDELQLFANSNVIIYTDTSNNTYQWKFGQDGNLTLPGDSRVAPVGANIELQAAAGGYAEIVTSDGNNYVAVTTSGAEIVTSGAYIWAFNNVGNLTLPGNTFAVNYANGSPVVISGGAAGLPLANGTSNINIATANGNVTVTANATTWTFGSNSKITLPNGASLNDTSGDSVAFGQNAGLTSQAQHAVAIGRDAGSSYQGEDSIAIGYQAGYHDQQRGVAIGYQAGVGGTLYRSVSDAQGGSGPVTTYSPSAPPDPSRLYVASTANIAVSQLVFGNNIQANTVVTGIYPGEDRVDITPNYTAAMTDGDPLTFVGVVIGINDASNIVYPMRVTGTNIPANTFVQSTGCSTVTLNQYPTAPLADGASLVFNIGQGPYSTAVGYRAGQSFQADGAVAIGYSAGLQNQSTQAVAVGQFAGYSNQSANAVAVGTNAGEFTQAVNAVAVGYKAGYSTQGARAVAIGEDAGFQNQGEDAVAVGQKAGFQTQGRWAVAIGNSAGRSGQQDKAVSIGYGTGAVSQQDWAVAIGANAASYNQGYDAVAIGELAGNTSQGNNSIAIGYLSGYDTQGANSIAIGAMAGQSVQGNNSIIINATGAPLDQTTANTFTVKPVRGDSTANLTGAGFKTVYYNSSTGEFAYSTD